MNVINFVAIFVRVVFELQQRPNELQYIYINNNVQCMSVYEYIRLCVMCRCVNGCVIIASSYFGGTASNAC